MMQYCAVCDRPIEDEYCYVFNEDFPDGACVCEECTKHQLWIMKKSRINQYFYDLVYGLIDEVAGAKRTPERQYDTLSNTALDRWEDM